jgi:hypothetical protein
MVASHFSSVIMLMCQAPLYDVMQVSTAEKSVTVRARDMMLQGRLRLVRKHDGSFHSHTNFPYIARFDAVEP